MDSKINYILRAELHSRMEGQKLQSYLFEREFHLKFLRKTGENSTFYNSELKMHFNNPSAIAFIYEIETINSEFICGDKLEKSADFIRRINYLYDWVQLRVNRNGKILSIENPDELTGRWPKIKESLLSDYKGKEVDEYLKNIDSKIEDEQKLFEIISQYFHFGLIFPHIPHAHAEQWSNKRLIEFSEYEEEKFEEETVFESLENSQRKYSITINTLANSQTKLQQYEGHIYLPENDIFPASAILEVVFHIDDVANQWYFKLERF